MEFKVKRDFLLVFLVNVLLVFLVCVTIPFAYNTWVFLVVFAICFSILIFYDTAVIFASCKVENDVLTYRTGAFAYKINVNSIVKVERTKNIYGSLALSCDRIRILTNENGKNKVYYVSVVDNEKLMSVISPKEQVVATPDPKVETQEKAVKKAPATKKVSTKTTATKKTTTKSKSSTSKKSSK